MRGRNPSSRPIVAPRSAATSAACMSAPIISGCRCSGSRVYPSIEDLDPQTAGDFGPHSVLLDFTAGGDDPAISYLGDCAAPRMRAGPRDRHDRRRAEPLAAVAPHRSLSADHRQSRADRVRGRVRQPAWAQHHVSRHIDALFVRRRHDRLRLRRDQLEGNSPIPSRSAGPCRCRRSRCPRLPRRLARCPGVGRRPERRLRPVADDDATTTKARAALAARPQCRARRSSRRRARPGRGGAGRAPEKSCRAVSGARARL